MDLSWKELLEKNVKTTVEISVDFIYYLNMKQHAKVDSM